MKQYITFQDKISEIIMDARHPQSKNKVFVLVEGDDDLVLFRRFFNKFCKIEPIPGGVSKLEEGLGFIPQHAKKINLLAIRDADFMHIENEKPAFDNLFLTDTHDTETMLIASDDAFSSVLHSYISFDNTQLYQLRESFLESVAFLGYLRWYNHLSDLKFNFSGLDLNKLLNVKSLSIDKKELIKEIIGRSSNATIKDENQILSEVLKLSRSQIVLFQICNGHDIVKVLVSFFKAKSDDRIGYQEVLLQLKTAFNFHCFIKTNLFSNLKSYSESKNLNIFISSS